MLDICHVLLWDKCATLCNRRWPSYCVSFILGLEMDNGCHEEEDCPDADIVRFIIRSRHVPLLKFFMETYEEYDRVQDEIIDYAMEMHVVRMVRYMLLDHCAGWRECLSSKWLHVKDCKHCPWILSRMFSAADNGQSHMIAVFLDAGLHPDSVAYHSSNQTDVVLDVVSDLATIKALQATGAILHRNLAGRLHDFLENENLDCYTHYLANCQSKIKPQHLALLLHEAVRKNDSTFVTATVEAGADVDLSAGTGYEPPLLIAYDAGHIEMVKLLVEKYGANTTILSL